MSELLNKIKSDSIVALKQRDTVKKTILSSLVSKSALIAKNDGNREVTDEDVIRAAKKTIREVTETSSFAAKSGRDTSAYDTEISVIESYLPAMMSEEELETLVKSIAAQAPAGRPVIAHVMSELNSKHSGLFDPKLASSIVKSL